jgi:mannose-6-phosphate isomerase-like protein (cupin superfamily)
MSAYANPAPTITPSLRPPVEVKARSISVHLARMPGFQVRYVIVQAGEFLPLRGHFRRGAHWVAIRGAGAVDVAGEFRPLYEQQSVFVPPATVYGVHNKGKVDLHLVEIQTGEYLETDDAMEPAMIQKMGLSLPKN